VGTKRAIGVHATVETTKEQSIALDAHVVPNAKGTRIVGLDADLRRRHFRARLHVAEIASANGRWTVDGFRLSSTAGGLRLDGSFAPRRHALDLDVASTELDVDELAFGLGLDPGALQLAMKIDASLHTHARSLRGAIEIAAKGALKDEAIDGALSFHIDDRDVKASAHGKLEDWLGVVLSGDGKLGGPWDEPRAWRDIVGEGELHVARVDLQKLAGLVRDLSDAPSSAHMAGAVSLDAKLVRDDASLPPMGTIALIGERVKIAMGTLAFDPIDARVTLKMEHDDDASKPKDEVNVSLEAFAQDAVGKLVALDASTHTRWASLVDLGDGGGLAQTTLDLPLQAHLDVPTRAIRKLPSTLRSLLPIDGAIGVKVSLDGTLRTPDVTVDATVAHVPSSPRTTHTLALHATYDGALAKIAGTVTRDAAAPTDARELDAAIEIGLRETDLLDGGGPPAWTAKIDATFDGLPLAMVSGLASEAISGRVYGEAHADHLHDPSAKSPTANAKLDVHDLVIGEAGFETTTLVANVDDTHAALDLAVSGRKSGKLHVQAEAPLRWKNALSPALATNGKMHATLDSESFALCVLEPVVTAFDRLDGRLDANLTLDVDAAMRGGVAGTAKIHDGVAILGAVGEPWKNVTGEIHFSPTAIDVPKLTLDGMTGSAELHAHADVAGLSPKSFHVELSPDRLPFATDGVPVGALTGKIVADGKIDPKATTIALKIDPLTVDLAPSSDKRPQDLSVDPSIVVDQPVEAPAAPPHQGPPIHVTVSIPDDVWIRRNDLHVAVSGDPTITVDAVVRVGGEIRIDPTMRPWIEQFGKRFTIQKANVKFDGSGEVDPTLDVAVLWTARDGTDVTIAVTGRSKSPKVTMTADPPATQAEIMSMLVLGRRDAGSASQQETAQRGAAAQTASLVQGMTGAILGQQLQKMLPTSMTLDFQPGEEGFADARYAGGVEWKNVYFEVGYNAGAGNATTLPGSTTQTSARTTFGADWRFRPEWSLMTTLGDTGSALVDLLWNFRY
jgi:autotransporter translocation and assembly factor TamB